MFATDAKIAENVTISKNNYDGRMCVNLIPYYSILMSFSSSSLSYLVKLSFKVCACSSNCLFSLSNKCQNETLAVWGCSHRNSSPEWQTHKGLSLTGVTESKVLNNKSTNPAFLCPFLCWWHWLLPSHIILFSLDLVFLTFPFDPKEELWPLGLLLTF